MPWARAPPQRRKETALGTEDILLDPYETYEELFDSSHSNREQHRRRKGQDSANPARSLKGVITTLAESAEELEDGFKPTYQPSRHEATWLLSSLRPFYDQALIHDVLALVKGGKEASVYRCAANPALGAPWAAAKVYRPRMFRNLRNDAFYRQGREVLSFNGSVVKHNDHREMRALDKKTDFGVQVQHTSWLMYEYTTMQRLYVAGAAVPRPLAVSDNAILMGYCGDERMAAPTLNQVRLNPREARSLLRQVLHNVALMLQLELIHGDLSAYNILYWQGEIVLIDFPQVINCYVNPHSKQVLERDIQRVCEYFEQQGAICDARAILGELWERHVRWEAGAFGPAAEPDEL
jgi:RIO kinase 1